ncbi:MAG: hypothetical protein HDQ98_00070 [Lachnospiraceae bacterium]|nr:hypothetical protein [Lachnospiraceae bacterium]
MMYEHMLKDMLGFFVELHYMVDAEYEAEKERSEEWKRRQEETFGLDVVN